MLSLNLVMQATCGGNCCGAGWFYCLMVSLGVGFVPQLITRGDIRKMHGMQVHCPILYQSSTASKPKTS